MEQIIPKTLLFCVAAGFLPTLLWLWFWLKEDNNPEPKRVIFLTFCYGMMSSGLALFAEYAISALAFSGIVALFLWALIEEFLKYKAAKKAAFEKKSFDEPVDALIYMITAALGFSSMENILFIFNSFSSNGMLSGFMTGNLRFLGATLLHTATSAIVGACLAFSFFHKEKMKYNVIGGIIIAGILHFIFNYFIIKSSGDNILKVFIPLWLLIIVIVFIFEKVKRIKKENISNIL